MDINQLETAPIHEEGREVQIKGPDGLETDVYIHVVGVDSKTWRKIARKMQKGVIEESLPDKYKDDGISERAESIAQATIGWRGITDDGKEVKFSKSKAFNLYRNAPYILNQVDVFIGNRANFMNS